MAIESPKYIILQKDNLIELREYSGYILATVTVEGATHDEAGSNAFSILAGFIFGNNIDGTKIAMTAPVAIQEQDVSAQIAMTAPVTVVETGSRYEVSFTMPASFTMETIPKPTDGNIVLHEVLPHTAGAITFKGATPEVVIAEKTKQLQAWIKANDLVESGTPQIAKYDGPSKPRFLRKNEILIVVSHAQ